MQAASWAGKGKGKGGKKGGKKGGGKQGKGGKDKDKDNWTGTRIPSLARRSAKGRRNGISMILWSGTGVLWAGPAILEAGTAVLWVWTAVLWTGTAVLEAARIDARCF